MSTRRARIKAVAALPPRRKNQENADAKNKIKEEFEKSAKSPKTPRGQTSKTEDKGSPSKSTLRSPPPLLPITSVTKTQNSDKQPSPATVSSPIVVDKAASTPKPEKVAVITSTPGVKSVFASPQVRSSPDRRRTASPLVLPSPKRTSNSESAKTAAHTVNAIDSSHKNTVSNTSQNIDKSHTPSGDKKSDIPDDYSVPSVPESITDEAVMDGIVPLQAAKSAPKPIDLLKNEIISECAEVSFDPIVPLPSPSKVRPKLRPVPRLAPHRRNSIQGSASESEDESRRALLSGSAPTPAPPRQRHDSQTSHSTVQSITNRDAKRIRNDSVSSSISQIMTQPPPAASSPVKEKQFPNKAKRQEMSRRSWCRRREVKRDALTMYDLIFYNPTTNPIVPDEDEEAAKEANAKAEAERNSKTQESEEEADDPPAADTAPAPVPQIKLGANGEIILDEQSLVIKQSDTRKVSSVVREGSWAGSGGGKYTRSARTAEWSAPETVRFYRALAAVGTDFTLMAPLFPDRKRKDLYLKFKKEERQNGAQVDKALRTATAWDPAALEADFKQERAEAARKAEEERERLLRKREEERARLKASKELRVKNSKGAKALETRMAFGAHSEELTADDFIQRTLEQRAREKQERELAKKLRKEKQSGELSEVDPPARYRDGPRISPAPTQGFATLTLLNNNATAKKSKPTNEIDVATISKLDPTNMQPQQVSLNEVAGLPKNIENGSLVVLRVNDPSSPTKTMLQTYIAHGAGKLTPVSLPPAFLNSVVGYMKKGTPKSTISTASSPQWTSPSSVASQDSRACTPGVIQLNPSPAKRTRHSSYNITPL